MLLLDAGYCVRHTEVDGGLMDRNVDRAVLAVAAAIYAGVGAWTLIDPLGALADVGVSVVDARGTVELRAMYGGLQLGMAVFLGWCLADMARVRIGLLAFALTIGGLGLARTGAWALERPDGWLLPVLCVVELTSAGVAAWRVARSG